MGSMEEHPENPVTEEGAPQKLELVLSQPVLAASEGIGTWSAVLMECRARTLKAIAGIGQAELDWRLADCANTIGSLLYHIALIEADWLYNEILERPMPDQLRLVLGIDDRTSDGKLSDVCGESASQHEYRLELVRECLLRALITMSMTEFRRVRHLREYDVSPEWAVVHLWQHEAEHRGQIVMLRRAFKDWQACSRETR